MSWNNVLPWWFYELEHECFLAEVLCALPDELHSGTMRASPAYIFCMHPSSFKSWEKGGYHYEESNS